MRLQGSGSDLGADRGVGRKLGRAENGGGGVGEGAVFLSSLFLRPLPVRRRFLLAPVTRPPHDLPLGLRGCLGSNFVRFPTYTRFLPKFWDSQKSRVSHFLVYFHEPCIFFFSRSSGGIPATMRRVSTTSTRDCRLPTVVQLACCWTCRELPRAADGSLGRGRRRCRYRSSCSSWTSSGRRLRCTWSRRCRSRPFRCQAPAVRLECQTLRATCHDNEANISNNDDDDDGGNSISKYNNDDDGNSISNNDEDDDENMSNGNEDDDAGNSISNDDEDDDENNISNYNNDDDGNNISNENNNDDDGNKISNNDDGNNISNENNDEDNGNISNNSNDDDRAFIERRMSTPKVSSHPRARQHAIHVPCNHILKNPPSVSLKQFLRNAILLWWRHSTRRPHTMMTPYYFVMTSRLLTCPAAFRALGPATSAATRGSRHSSSRLPSAAPATGRYLRAGRTWHSVHLVPHFRKTFIIFFYSWALRKCILSGRH